MRSAWKQCQEPLWSTTENTIVRFLAAILCGTAGTRLCINVAFRILPVIQVRTTFGCRPLSISNSILADAALGERFSPSGLRVDLFVS
jgi:hypothetical protein